MIRRLPVLPTIIVLLAAATMVGLGIWQLGRARQKEALLAQYRAAAGLPPVAWPTQPLEGDALPLFRQATGTCLQPMASKAVAGRNRAGESGYSLIVDCRTGAEGPGMRIDAGWTRDPRPAFSWSGGPVAGTVGPDSQTRIRLVSDTGLGGLQPSAAPDLETIPNNHRSYALQWFLFAGLALLIYGLAVRAKLKEDR